MRLDPLDASGLSEIIRRISDLESAPTLFASSVDSGRIRIGGSAQLLVDASGGIVVNGSFVGSGGFTWSGPMSLTGTQTVTGILNVNGPWNLAGTGGITGAISCTGNWTWTGQLLVNTGGSIQIAGSNTMTLGQFGGVSGIGFATGGQLLGSSAGGLILSSSGSGSLAVTPTGAIVQGTLSTTGLATLASLSVTGAKSFRMPHPSKPGYDIQHGSTESPISGTEYTGQATFAENGQCVVTLPPYFEALNKPGNRTVQITPIGAPFAVGSDEIVAGKFTVYGMAGRKFFWLVKAERFGGDFELEPIISTDSL